MCLMDGLLETLATLWPLFSVPLCWCTLAWIWRRCSWHGWSPSGHSLWTQSCPTLCTKGLCKWIHLGKTMHCSALVNSAFSWTIGPIHQHPIEVVWSGTLQALGLLLKGGKIKPNLTKTKQKPFQGWEPPTWPTLSSLPTLWLPWLKKGPLPLVSRPPWPAWSIIDPGPPSLLPHELGFLPFPGAQHFLPAEEELRMCLLLQTYSGCPSWNTSSLEGSPPS